MLDQTPIHSAANPIVKRVRAVRRGAERELMILEGSRLVQEALSLGLIPQAILVAERRSELVDELERPGHEVRLLSNDLFDSLSSLTSAPGVLALVRPPARLGLERLPTGSDALVVAVAGIQDPGNLGALARTAEAAGARALVVLAGGCRPWNEKALRGSMGSLLRLPVHEVDDIGRAWDELASAGFRHVVARTRGGGDYTDFDWSGRIVLWVTAESGTLPEEIAERFESAAGVSIPMAGGVESLNVTTAAALLLFAARRVESVR